MDWQERERQLLLKETQYIRDFNAFERIFDNHLLFCIVFLLLLPLGFGLGLGIGLLL